MNPTSHQTIRMNPSNSMAPSRDLQGSMSMQSLRHPQPGQPLQFVNGLAGKSSAASHAPVHTLRRGDTTTERFQNLQTAEPLQVDPIQSQLRSTIAYNPISNNRALTHQSSRSGASRSGAQSFLSDAASPAVNRKLGQQVKQPDVLSEQKPISDEEFDDSIDGVSPGELRISLHELEGDRASEFRPVSANQFANVAERHEQQALSTGSFNQDYSISMQSNMRKKRAFSKRLGSGESSGTEHFMRQGSLNSDKMTLGNPGSFNLKNRRVTAQNSVQASQTDQPLAPVLPGMHQKFPSLQSGLTKKSSSFAKTDQESALNDNERFIQSDGNFVSLGGDQSIATASPANRDDLHQISSLQQLFMALSDESQVMIVSNGSQKFQIQPIVIEAMKKMQLLQVEQERKDALNLKEQPSTIQEEDLARETSNVMNQEQDVEQNQNQLRTKAPIRQQMSFMESFPYSNKLQSEANPRRKSFEPSSCSEESESALTPQPASKEDPSFIAHKRNLTSSAGGEPLLDLIQDLSDHEKNLNNPQILFRPANPGPSDSELLYKVPSVPTNYQGLLKFPSVPVQILKNHSTQLMKNPQILKIAQKPSTSKKSDESKKGKLQTINVINKDVDQETLFLSQNPRNFDHPENQYEKLRHEVSFNQDSLSQIMAPSHVVFSDQNSDVNISTIRNEQAPQDLGLISEESNDQEARSNVNKDATQISQANVLGVPKGGINPYFGIKQTNKVVQPKEKEKTKVAEDDDWAKIMMEMQSAVATVPNGDKKTDKVIKQNIKVVQPQEEEKDKPAEDDDWAKIMMDMQNSVAAVSNGGKNSDQDFKPKTFVVQPQEENKAKPEEDDDWAKIMMEMQKPVATTPQSINKTKVNPPASEVNTTHIHKVPLPNAGNMFNAIPKVPLPTAVSLGNMYKQPVPKVPVPNAAPIGSMFNSVPKVPLPTGVSVGNMFNVIPKVPLPSGGPLGDIYKNVLKVPIPTGGPLVNMYNNVPKVPVPTGLPIGYMYSNVPKLPLPSGGPIGNMYSNVPKVPPPSVGTIGNMFSTVPKVPLPSGGPIGNMYSNVPKVPLPSGGPIRNMFNTVPKVPVPTVTRMQNSTVLTKVPVPSVVNKIDSAQTAQFNDSIHSPMQSKDSLLAIENNKVVKQSSNRELVPKVTAMAQQDLQHEINGGEGDFIRYSSMPRRTSDISETHAMDVVNNLFSRSPPDLFRKTSIDDIILEDEESRDSNSNSTPCTTQFDEKESDNKQQRLMPSIREVNSSDQISYMDDQSHLGSVQTFLDQSKLIGSKEKGIKLNILKENNNNLSQIDIPVDSGDPLTDQISQFAYAHGIDPKIFIEKDEGEAMRALNQLALSLGPTVERNKKLRRGALNINKHSIPHLMNQEIQDTRKMLFDTHYSDKNNQQRQQTSSPQSQKDISFERGIGSQDNRFLSLNNLSNSLGLKDKKILMEQLNESRDSQNSKNDKKSNQQLIDMMLQVRNETLKNKVQTAVLCLTFNRYLNNQDHQKIVQINRQVQILKQHDKKMANMNKIFLKLKKEIHFAFMFASPLVLKKSKDAFLYFPMLNFSKEFVKIKESIAQAQIQINITKRQCTPDSMQDILAQKPIGLHFSGHGILNNMDLGADFYDQHKGQGDFLVLENEQGGTELVSREQLKIMIKGNECELDFVFVATCHSEFVGRIFQQAGARHVICIKHSQEVRDDAIIAFTDTFYNMIFEQKKEICTAFYQAQLSVEIGFSEKEASIFRLLLNDQLVDQTAANQGQGFSGDVSKISSQSDHNLTYRSSGQRLKNQKQHTCTIFGPFTQGTYNTHSHQTVSLINKAPKMPNLRGRQKDMFRVIDKLLNSKSSRLFNLIGWPGVGKSALIASILEYIEERDLLKGGSVYFNARNLSICEQFIRNFNQSIVSDNEKLLQKKQFNDYNKQEPIETLKSILTKLNSIDGEIVLVIDNVEDLIQNERGDFQMLVSMMLTRVSQLKHTREFKEDKIVLSNLSNVQSSNLFKENMSRDLNQTEINNLLKTKPCFTKYPDEEPKWPYRSLHEHHLFTLLNGNPQSIILVASLLADPQRKLTLKQVYKMLTDDELFKVLSDEGIEEGMLVSLRLSAQLSVQAIQESDPESMDLLYLLGLLPGGIKPNELDYLWIKVSQENRKMNIEATGQLSSKQNEEAFNLQRGRNWRRAFAELQRAKLAIEKNARRNSVLKQGVDLLGMIQKQQNDGGPVNIDDSDQQNTVIILPQIVRNFSEGKITVESCDFFLQILSIWYYDQLHDIYTKNQNVVYDEGSRELMLAFVKFECLEDNIALFLHHMQEKYQDDKYSGLEESKNDSKMDVDLTKLEASETSSLTDEDISGFAEQMFSPTAGQSDQNQRFDFPKIARHKVTPPVRQLTTPDNIFPSQSSVGLKGITNSLSKHKSQQNSPQRQAIHKPQYKPDMKSLSVVEEKQEINVSKERKEIKKDIQKPPENERMYKALHQAYEATQKLKPALERYDDAKKQKEKHPKEIEDRVEKAQQYWRWAFEKVKEMEKEKKKMCTNNAIIEKVNGSEAHESFNSGFSDSSCDTSDDSDEYNDNVDTQQVQSKTQKNIQVINASTPKNPQNNYLAKIFRKSESSFPMGDEKVSMVMAPLKRQKSSIFEMKKQVSNRKQTLQQVKAGGTQLVVNFKHKGLNDSVQIIGKLPTMSRRENSRMSVFNKKQQEQQTLTKREISHQLNQDEKTMISYLINLVLFKQFNLANSLIDKHFLRMLKCSNIFKANIRRLQAMALFGSFQPISDGKQQNLNRQKSSMDDMQSSDYDNVDKCLKRAEKYFKRADSAQGLGLTYYQQAGSLIHRIDQNIQGNYIRKGVHRMASPLMGDAFKKRKSLENGNQYMREYQEDQLIDRAKFLLEQAVEQFKKINHWRGLFNSYRHLDRLVDHVSDFMSDRSPVRPIEGSEEYKQMSSKYLNLYDVSRYDAIDQDVTITRWGGDELSLLTEIVICKDNIKMFSDDPDEHLSRFPHNRGKDKKPKIVMTKLDSSHTNTLLSCVEEDQSEAAYTGRNSTSTKKKITEATGDEETSQGTMHDQANTELDNELLFNHLNKDFDIQNQQKSGTTSNRDKRISMKTFSLKQNLTTNSGVTFPSQAVPIMKRKNQSLAYSSDDPVRQSSMKSEIVEKKKKLLKLNSEEFGGVEQ